jgi:hypothetical protein
MVVIIRTRKLPPKAELVQRTVVDGKVAGSSPTRQ